VRVFVLDPPKFETTKVIVKVPCDWYWWTGFCCVEVDEAPAPSPKFQDHVRGH
jgi:hypothetical protein